MNCNVEGPKLDLKLNLSPPRAYPRRESPNRQPISISPMELSPPRSCVSSELSQDDAGAGSFMYSRSSPEAVTSMMLAGCPRCLMYVMLQEDDPKCPKCKSTVLLDLLHEGRTKKTNK